MITLCSMWKMFKVFSDNTSPLITLGARWFVHICNWYLQAICRNTPFNYLETVIVWSNRVWRHSFLYILYCFHIFFVFFVLCMVMFYFFLTHTTTSPLPSHHIFEPDARWHQVSFPTRKIIPLFLSASLQQVFLCSCLRGLPQISSHPYPYSSVSWST